MALQAGIGLRRLELIEKIEAALNVHVQLGRAGGRRVVTDIAYTPKA